MVHITDSSTSSSSRRFAISKGKRGSYTFDNPVAGIDSTDINGPRNSDLDNDSTDRGRESACESRKYSKSMKSLKPFRTTPNDEMSYQLLVEYGQVSDLSERFQDVLFRRDGKIPVNNIGFFSYLFISWMTPLTLKLFKHRNEEIRKEDVWQCSDWESVATNTERLEVLWKNEIRSYGEKNSSFLRVWLKFIRTRQLILILVVCLNSTLTFLMMGYMTDLIVSYLEAEESNLFYAIGLLLSNFVGQILRACSFGFIFFFGGQTGIRFRAGVLGLAYKKLLKLKRIKGDTSSEIITIFGSDSLRFYLNCQRITIILGFPIYLVIGAAYTYYLIGPWCFIAIGIYMLAYQLQGMLTLCITPLRRKSLMWTDKRIRFMTEVLHNMKMIKMYAWEEPFLESIKRTRNKETNALMKLSILTFISSSILPVTPTLCSVTTLAAYAAFGNKLKASTAFSLVATMNFIKVIMSILTPATRTFGETKVSFERLKRLLLKEEYVPPSRKVAMGSNAIEIRNSLFDWGSDCDSDVQSIADKIQLPPDTGNRTTISSLKLKINSLNIQKGKLIGICGAVGCGKSSLLSSILGRMPILSGHLAVDGSVAYASQQAWIFNGTLKENVVFGSTYDSEWYTKVIYSCGLQPDIELLPNGDETEIGDRGINLSGGQKQRVSLARAVYSDCDIYLLDDPLSAVDVHVGNHLFRECIKKLLKKKTVILVTHQLQYLEYCDEILVMEDGEIVEHGTHDDLLEKSRKYTSLMSQFNSTKTESTKGEGLTEHDQGSIEEGSKSDNHVARSKINNIEKGKLTTKEKVETGSVGLSAYKSYLNAAGGICVSVMVFLQYVFVTGSVLFSDLWLGIWINQRTAIAPTTFNIQQNTSLLTSSSWNFSPGNTNASAYAKLELQDDNFYINIYVWSLAAIMLSIVLKGFATGVATLRASERLHNRALARVMKAPMTFFDANPPGRILNRFSKDIEEGDVHVPECLDVVLQIFLAAVASLVSTAITLPWFLIPLAPALFIFFIVKKISSACLLQLKRLENIARSPLINHITTTAQGLCTIVSYKKQNYFINKCTEYADMTSVGLFLLDGNIRWTSLILDILASVLTVSLAIVIVFTKDIVPTALAALALSLCIRVLAIGQYFIRMINALEASLTSVERLHEYEGLEIEKETLSVKPEGDWPDKGAITFSNVVMKYRNDLDPALRHITFDILPKQKIGIVGRTGAGKSSLAAALFRLVDVSSGCIYIDGVDIGLIPRTLLRSKLSVIPQDPVLFAGTLRYNLDPFGKHSDSELWSALEQVHIKEKIQQYAKELDLSIEENGENFSVGERQLMCLARAILRQNKILVLDEATASIDTATDAMIQNTIRNKFSDCTVLTIAHRLNTVIQCDVIFVMEAGCIVEIGEPQDLLLNPSSHFNIMVRSQATNLPNDQGHL